MKNKNERIIRFAFATVYIVIGLVAGLLFSLAIGVWMPYASDEIDIPGACNGDGFLCFLYTWQTLITGSLAFAGALITVLVLVDANNTQKRAIKIPFQKEQLYAVGKAQLVVTQLEITQREIQKFIESHKRGEQVARVYLTIIPCAGTNIPEAIDPFMCAQIDNIWDALRSEIEAAKQNLTESPELHDSDIARLSVAIGKIEDTRNATRQTVIEPIVRYFQNLGMKITRDENGLYRDHGF